MDHALLPKESVRLFEHQVGTFALDCLKRLNLTSIPETKPAPDMEIKSNEEFWRKALDYNVEAFNTILLKGFQIADWFPHSPGLFHTYEARESRNQSAGNIVEIDGIRHYLPDEKLSMINGGIGSVRFQPLDILQDYFRLPLY